MPVVQVSIRGLTEPWVSVADRDEQLVLTRVIEFDPAVVGEPVAAQQPHDEFINRRDLLHELPGVFPVPQALVDDNAAFVDRLSAQHLKARPLDDLDLHALRSHARDAEFVKDAVEIGYRCELDVDLTLLRAE